MFDEFAKVEEELHFILNPQGAAKFLSSSQHAVIVAVNNTQVATATTWLHFVVKLKH